MNEMMKMTPPPEREETEFLKETVVTEYGGIYEHNGDYYAATHSREGVVPVPEEVADMIGLALRAQTKVYEGSHPNLEKKLRMLNCRKAAFVASGRMTAAEASDSQNEDLNGLEHLYEDVERLQNEGHYPFLVQESYSKEIEFFLNEYDGDFPCVLHLFEVEKNGKKAALVAEALDEDESLPKEVVSRLHRSHSFVVLGKSDEGYTCFQKFGPEVGQPFMIAELGTVLFPYALAEDREGVVFMGPM